jgi:deubiquitinase DESI2
MGSSAAGSTPTARQQRGAGVDAGAAPSSSSPVFLNVYDVTPANGYARWLGLGVYHSGVQGTWTTGSLPPSSPPSVLTLRHGPRVILTRLLSLSLSTGCCAVHGVEYAYGAHDGASSGIFEVVPRRCPGYAFRESVAVGATELSRGEVRALMAELAAEFPGDAYNLVSRNCNHFCDAACRRLVARARIPRWVNRLAKIGVAFTCVIPGNGRAARPPSAASRSRSRSAPPRPRTFFRTFSVGPRRNMTAPSPPAHASASTSSGSTT